MMVKGVNVSQVQINWNVPTEAGTGREDDEQLKMAMMDPSFRWDCELMDHWKEVLRPSRIRLANFFVS